MYAIKSDKCRICLGSDSLIDIFTTKTSTTIAEKIIYCATVQVSPEDSLPSKICIKCGFYLNVAYVFKTVCEWSYFKLQHELEQTEGMACIEVGAGNSIQQTLNSCLPKITQCSKTCLEQSQNREHSTDIHLIDSLLSQEYLETYRFFSCKRDELNVLEQALNDILLQKDTNHLCHNADHKLFCEGSGVINDALNCEAFKNALIEEKTDLNKEMEITKKNIDSVDNEIMINRKLDLANEKTGSKHFNDIVDKGGDSVTEKDGSVNQEDSSNIQDSSLVNEESLLKYKEHTLNNKDNVINFSKNRSLITEFKAAVTDCDCLMSEDCTEENGLVVDMPLLHSGEGVTEFNVINKDHGLITGSNFTDDLGNSWSIYGKVCLHAEDPLLPKVTSLENEETELKNLAANEDASDLKNIFSQNKIERSEESRTVKRVSLASISLHDFENFEREQLNNVDSHCALLDYNIVRNCNTDNDNKNQLNNQILAKNIATTQLENRVGRHIAKKNAGQPPKRYSPTPEAAKHPNTFNCLTHALKQKIIKDDPSIAPKHAKMDEDEEKLHKTTELKNMDSILDQEYILENDMSMPEPIFEETIVTDSFYLANDAEGFLASNVSNQHNNTDIKKDVLEGRRRKKIGSAKLKPRKKINVFIDQTVRKRVRSKRSIETNNTYNIRIKTNKANFQNDLDWTCSGSDAETDSSNDCDNNFETDLNLDKNKNKTNVVHDFDDQDQQHSYTKQKLANKKSKIKRKGSNTTCKLCNKSFPFPSHLQRHLTAHIGIKRFICTYCNKEFLHRYNLSVHMRSHTGNFPLQCDICKRGFASPSVLERHKRSHTRETPFQCQYCLQLFSHTSSLNMHEKMHLNRPAFACDICYKVFSYKSSLTAHKKGHSGFKPHSCSVCHKRFTRRTSVMRHMSCHSEAKKFKCRTCSEVLNSKRSLMKHRKMHSNK